eukprot:747562-Pyramimonas_sp.AAC.1
MPLRSTSWKVAAGGWRAAPSQCGAHGDLARSLLQPYGRALFAVLMGREVLVKLGLSPERQGP